jgi:putative hydrolase of the HAD superfamily
LIVTGFNAVKHLSLDLWLTIIRSNSAFKPSRAVLFKECFGVGQSTEEILNVFQDYDRLFNSINECTGGNMSRNEMLLIILSALGKDINSIPVALLDEFYVEAEALFFRYPPEGLDNTFPDILRQIRGAGITTSLLSNTAFISGSSLRKLLPLLGYAGLFDFQIYSDEVGWSKPSDEIFNLLYQEASAIRPISRSQILHVGDNAVADFDGSVRAGYKAILFKPNEESLGRLLSPILCTHHLHYTV